MASINYAAREISVKIVYYGPGLSGKTTNLQVIHRKVPPDHKSDMVSLATETDRTLFFDFLPLDLGTIKGFSTKFQLYTVPGQVYYNATRKLVLRGVDGVVFVADSAADKIPENIESLQNLEDNLAEYHYKREEIPIIIQYNKRDLPNALPIEELHRQVNKYNLPWTEAVANKGIGVFDSLKLMGKIVIDNLNRKYSRLSRGAPSGATSRAAVPQVSQPGRPAGEYLSPQQQITPPYQQQYAAPVQQEGYGTMPTAPYVQPRMPPQPSVTPQQPVRRPPVSRSAAPYPAPASPMAMAPQQTPIPARSQPQSPSDSGRPYPQYGAPQQVNMYTLPQGGNLPEDGKQQYGSVNFETLPIEPPPSQSATEPVYPGVSPVKQDSDMNVAPAEAAPPTGEIPAQPALQQTAGTEQPPLGNNRSVMYPQKQRPPRTQIDERDYSVYHIDPASQSLQPNSSLNDTGSMDDTDIRIKKNLDTPPGKQPKGFLSKFFNRDEQ
jgi:signal recognition particle receptor subunit beta